MLWSSDNLDRLKMWVPPTVVIRRRKCREEEGKKNGPGSVGEREVGGGGIRHK